MNDTEYMQRALELASRGRHATRPNPMVGAVVVRDGHVVGEGWHQQAGGPHAEVFALHAAGERARGATLYVTLEPCSHTGKTPPCADLIIRCGIQRVVCAMQDPFGEVNGEGIRRLQAAGIRVTVGVLEKDARYLNRGYLSVIQRHRPYIVGKWAMTLDGKTATAGGESQWITGTSSRIDAHRLRARADAVAVGIGTVLADNPRLTVRHGDTSRQPLCVVWDTYARIPLLSRLLQERAEEIVVLVGRECNPDKQAAIRATGATVVALPLSAAGRIDTESALQALATKWAVQVLMVEGGAALLGELLDWDCLDEIVTYIAPTAFGGTEAKGATAGKGVIRLAEARRYTIADIARCGSDVRLTYTRAREEDICSQD